MTFQLELDTVVKHGKLLETIFGPWPSLNIIVLQHANFIAALLRSCRYDYLNYFDKLKYHHIN